MTARYAAALDSRVARRCHPAPDPRVTARREPVSDPRVAARCEPVSDPRVTARCEPVPDPRVTARRHPASDPRVTAPRRMRCDFPWTLAVVALAIAATAAAFASSAFAGAVVADARIAHGQPWRAVTGPFVHATWGHLVRDLALVALAGVTYEAPLRSRRALLFGAGLVLPALAVLAAGDAQWYCGLSGLSHALLAAALSYELAIRRGRARALIGVLCAICALKPLYELVTGAPAFAMPLGPDIVQVPLAHAVGVLVGILCGLLAARDRRPDRPKQSRP